MRFDDYIRELEAGLDDKGRQALEALRRHYDAEAIDILREENERLQAFVLLAEARDWISKEESDQLMGLRPPRPEAAASALTQFSQELGLYEDDALDLVCEEGESVRELAVRVGRYHSALRRIAAPVRPDGTYNLGREACEQIAKKALAGGGDSAARSLPTDQDRDHAAS